MVTPAAISSLRNRYNVLGFGDDLLPAAIAADEGCHPLPNSEVGDIGAKALHGAGDLGARRKRKRRRHLIFVAEQERIEEVEADRRHLDENVVRARGWCRDLLEAQRLRSAKFAKLRNAHQPCSLHLPTKPAVHV
jgi:hypothetical protein